MKKERKKEREREHRIASCVALSEWIENLRKSGPLDSLCGRVWVGSELHSKLPHTKSLEWKGKMKTPSFHWTETKVQLDRIKIKRKKKARKCLGGRRRERSAGDFAQVSANLSSRSSKCKRTPAVKTPRKLNIGVSEELSVPQWESCSSLFFQWKAFYQRKEGERKSKEIEYNENKCSHLTVIHGKKWGKEKGQSEGEKERKKERKKSWNSLNNISHECKDIESTVAIYSCILDLFFVFSLIFTVSYESEFNIIPLRFR